MYRQIYFENLTSGMQAKLNTRYRIPDNHFHINNGINSRRTFYPNRSKTGFLGDEIMMHNRLR